ncbi:transport protein TonB [mine drainage metagenome]|uniref:Transport protein TonB n=1 Tax=mine drainage metagenome TaxID=410659 RepID=A0A1J5QSV3_9ZZZZ
MIGWQGGHSKDRLAGFLLLSAMFHGLLLAGHGFGRTPDHAFQSSALEVRLQTARRPDSGVDAPAATDRFATLPLPPSGLAAGGGEAGARPDHRQALTFAWEASVGDHYFLAAELDEQPHPMQDVRPSYPAHAMAHDLEGWVRLLLLIDETGQVRQLAVIDASPHGIFDEAALNAFRFVPFSPAKRAGLPVKSRILLNVDFSLLSQAPGLPGNPRNFPPSSPRDPA